MKICEITIICQTNDVLKFYIFEKNSLLHRYLKLTLYSRWSRCDARKYHHVEISFQRHRLSDARFLSTVPPLLTRTRSFRWNSTSWARISPRMSYEIQIPRHARRRNSLIHIKYSCYAGESSRKRDSFREENVVHCQEDRI